MENIYVFKTISRGMFKGYNEIDKIFQPDQLQKAIDYIQSSHNPSHWYSVSQGDIKGISGEELINDRINGENYNDLSGY